MVIFHSYVSLPEGNHPSKTYEEPQDVIIFRIILHRFLLKKTMVQPAGACVFPCGMTTAGSFTRFGGRGTIGLDSTGVGLVHCWESPQGGGQNVDFHEMLGIWWVYMVYQSTRKIRNASPFLDISG